ncbi:MAG TPA: type II secretion system F family protein [Caulobacteraceae bacterium]|nr:type II secretion system F family protein [Caulobacteraceae bacterium]
MSLVDDIGAFFVSPGVMLALGLGANAVALVVLWRAFAPDVVVNVRARAHAKRRRELRTEMLQTRKSSRRERPVLAVRSLLVRLKLTRGDEVRKAAEALAGAGWRSADALTIFLGFRLASPLSIGLLVFLCSPLVLAHAPMLLRSLVAMGGAVLGALAPNIVLNNAVTRRRQKIVKQMPDALDLFVICAEAGLGLDASFGRVAREIGPTSPEFSDELTLTAIELGFLPNRRDALANLAKRADIPQIRSLVNTLVQTERYGTPLAQSLRVLAGEYRNQRLMKAEEKAARLPATLTVPMIVFILPPLFIVLIGPAIIQVLAAMHQHR